LDEPGGQTDREQARGRIMKIGGNVYSAVTSACLLLGVASAFGFDRTSHTAWVLLGGCAGAVAIVTYFIRHWQTIPRRETDVREPVPPRSVWTSDWQAGQVPAHVSRARLSSGQRGLAARSVSVTKARPFSASEPGPAEMVAKILKQLEETGRRNVYELTFAKDGSVTFRFTDRVEQAPTEYVRPATVTRSYETVH
jgi:hypothetical protein